MYIVDYKELEGITESSEEGATSYNAHPLGLFYVKNSGDLVPIAIQLFQQPSETNPIWTPDDAKYDWLLAKMWLRHADYKMQQVCNTSSIYCAKIARIYCVKNIELFSTIAVKYNISQQESESEGREMRPLA